MTTIIIGLILKKIVSTLIFMLVFIPMRSTAGGYHCETAGKCYLFSMVVYLMVVFTYDCFEFGLSDLCVLICFIDFIVIVKLSPVISNNNPFVAKKKSRNRRISIDLSLIYILAYIVMIKSKIIYANEIFLSLTIAVIFMIIGYIKQKRV
jgi:accessory gene regulator B